MGEKMVGAQAYSDMKTVQLRTNPIVSAAPQLLSSTTHEAFRILRSRDLGGEEKKPDQTVRAIDLNPDRDG